MLLSARRAASVLGLAGLTIMGSVVAAPPSVAAPSCGAYMVCVWRDASFSGPKFYWIDGDAAPELPGMTYNNSSSSLNDSISSLYNNTNHWVEFCVDSVYHGACDVYGPGVSVAHNPGGHGDRYSSMRFL